MKRIFKFYILILVFFATGAVTTMAFFQSGIMGKTEIGILDGNLRAKYQVVVDEVAELAPEKESKPTSAKINKIKSAPPTVEEPKKTDLVENIVTNNDGSTTTTISSGDSDQEDIARVLSNTTSVTEPYEITYTDQTGQYPALESILKDYLNITLKWGTEISAMKEIIVKDAGATGWAGLYSGSYTRDASGNIVSATGFITLNVYYYKSDPLFEDYMKLVFSHEYGHHFTLYHKWVNFDLPIGTRFPDSYYSTRPLSLATTTTDYSLGWGNCDVEIIAEDYSYIYSGYQSHLMSGTYGYPSAATKTWLENFALGKVTTVVDNAPTVLITSPAASASVSGTATIAATASDDYGVAKVAFYLNDNLINEDTTEPYSYSLNTLAFENGSYTLKAIVTDSSNKTGENSLNFNISNQTSEEVVPAEESELPVSDTQKPQISFSKPTTDPYAWTEGNLQIELLASDDVAVSKIQLYINDQLVLESAELQITAVWKYNNVGPGEYTLKAIATDSSSNTAEKTLIVNKS